MSDHIETIGNKGVMWNKENLRIIGNSGENRKGREIGKTENIGYFGKVVLSWDSRNFPENWYSWENRELR